MGRVRLCGMGGTSSLAWRTFDSQYWGSAQRRKRIFLVADFGGFTAGEILFERKSSAGDSAESEGEREEAATNVGASVDSASICWAMNQPSNKINDYSKQTISPTLTARMGTGGNQVPIVHSVSDSASETLTPWDVQSNRIQSINGKAATLYGGAGQGTHNGAVFDTRHVAYSFDSLASNSMKSKNPHSGCRQVEVSKTLDTTRPDPSKNQGGIAIVQTIAIEGNGSRPSHKGNGYKETDKMYTLNATEVHGVGVFPQQAFDEYGEGKPLSTLKAQGGSYGGGSESLVYQKNVGALCMDDYKGANNQYVDQDKCVIQQGVRRLTPLECERLQMLPDEWSNVEFNGKPAPDSKRYKAIGNGMAQCQPDWIMKRIAEVANGQNEGHD